MHVKVMSQTNFVFADRVRRVLDEHGLTLRAQRRRTGLAHSTVRNWLDGVQPGMQAVVDFARGFGLDVNEWLVLAGYEPLTAMEPSEPPDLDDVLAELARLEADALEAGELVYEPELEALDVRQYGGARDIPQEDLEILNQAMRAAIALKRLETKQRREQREQASNEEEGRR